MRSMISFQLEWEGNLQPSLLHYLLRKGGLVEGYPDHGIASIAPIHQRLNSDVHLPSTIVFISEKSICYRGAKDRLCFGTDFAEAVCKCSSDLNRNQREE